jgi:tartrate-resistant acid phosphatase type 5
LTSGAGSKAWRGIDTEADMTGLQFYYDGQGFMSMSISQTALSFQFYDVFGNALHGKSINKTSAAS